MIPDADIVWDKREQSRIEAQIKKQQELKLIGRMKKVPGAHSVLFQLQNRRDQAGRRDSGVCDGL